MRTTLALIAALAFSFLLVPDTGLGETVDLKLPFELKLHFEEGQQFTLTTTVAQTSTSWWNDEEQVWANTTSTTMALDVFDVDDEGTAYMKVTVQSIAIKSDSGRWSYEYDSDNPPDEVPRPAAAFAAMEGLKYHEAAVRARIG